MRGKKDGDRDIQLEWRERAAKEGYTDERARAAARKFRAEFDALENPLAQHPYLLGRDLSVLDIAWFIYAHRLLSRRLSVRAVTSAARRLRPKLRAKPEFGNEIATPPSSMPPRGHAQGSIAGRQDPGGRGRVIGGGAAARFATQVTATTGVSVKKVAPSALMTPMPCPLRMA